MVKLLSTLLGRSQLSNEGIANANSTVNSELRTGEEVVRSKFKKSPMCNTQISKGKEKKRASMLKRDFFEWLILFQPKLKQEGKVIT